MHRALASTALAAALLALSGCSDTRAARRYSRERADEALRRLEVVALELGEFAIDGASAVVDGDTIRVKGLDNSLRLLAIDTEETFKTDEERRVFADGWEQYKKAMRGNSARPVKMATPLGEDAKKWAQEFFEGVRKIRLERDHPGEIRDYYGRYLAYVVVEKDGQRMNFNVECVRAGMSPYFVKYGRSRRFHREFLEAQEEAQNAKRGVWDPAKQHYDDYEERHAWWGERERAITRFEKEMAGNPEYVALTRWDALLKLEQRLGQDVVLLGAVNDVQLGDKGPTIVKLGRSRGNDFDVVFFDKDVVLSSGVLHKKGEYVQVRGVVNKFRDRYRNVDRLQVLVSLPGQVLAPSHELEKLLNEHWNGDGKPAPPPPDEPD
ncbi:MAG: thermonuclease family protein [Myxococcales bacterium]|nr:thermonuclease family protein [Myxococcales bacterium]